MINYLKIQLQILILKLRILLLQEQLTIPGLNIPNKIIVHHEAGWLDFNGVNEYHKQKWGFKSSLGFYIGYQYFIDRSGIITQGRADNEEGAHCIGQNKQSIGICLMGNGQEQDFTLQQYQSLESFLETKRSIYGFQKSDVYGHRDFSDTICPSDVLYNWLKDYKNKI